MSHFVENSLSKRFPGIKKATNLLVTNWLPLFYSLDLLMRLFSEKLNNCPASENISAAGTHFQIKENVTPVFKPERTVRFPAIN